MARKEHGSVTDGRTVIILAAGEGKRMRSALPKMLHPLLGRTLLGHVIAATTALHPSRRIVVVGHGADHRSAGPAARHRPRGPAGP
jgi:bifunctional UDP-N-acetylglucosamine pyrophosphorylase / glucosamine-1-phosphate N-acetyltransferase